MLLLVRNISTFALLIKLQHDSTAEPYPTRRKTSASSSQTRKSTHRSDKNDCFTLIVGSNRNEILVHANYLVQDSEFFEDMLTQQWFVPHIVLPDVDYDTLTSYLNFAYTEKFTTAHLVGPVCETFTGDEYLSLVHLYFLGEHFQNQATKHTTPAEMKRISTLFDTDTTATFPGPEDIDVIYRGTSEGDAARRLVCRECFCTLARNRVQPDFHAGSGLQAAQ